LNRPTVLKLAGIAAVAAVAVVPLPRAAVERVYSNGVYPLVQSRLTALSNRVPVSIGDVLGIALALGIVAWWGTKLARAERGGRARLLGSLGFDTAVLAALVYAAFLALWGFNYLREPLAARIDYDPARVTGERAEELLRLTIERLNAEYAAAHARPRPGEAEMRVSLERAFARALEETGTRRVGITALPKRSLFDPLLASAGIDGFTNPFGHEVVLNAELLPIERPFLLAHEWGHVAGLADESEASFVALVACVRSDDPLLRYSGWLALVPYLPRGPGRELPRLAPAVVADLRAIARRSERRYSPAVGRIQSAVYDRFLKVHRVEGGIGSYALIVRLALGSRALLCTTSSSSPTR
jgi:hypothetical protein